MSILNHTITIYDLLWAGLVWFAFRITLAQLRSQQERDPNLHMDKGGHNDLSKWQNFGGTLKRPPPPARITPVGPPPNQGTAGHR